MPISTSIENNSGGRFVVWCTIFAFFFNIMSYSALWGATYPPQKTSTSHNFEQILNKFVGLFANDAFADDDEDVDLKVVTDLVPSGDYSAGNNTGSFSYSYPIDIPSGRAGLTPKLSLKYSSLKGNGFLGIGWDMTMSYIERETKFGEPYYNNNDAFKMKLNGISYELIKNDSGGYRTKKEGAFLNIVKSSNTWTATDKNGTKYYFGTKPDGSTTDAQLIPYTGKIFRWCLKTIQDLDGNIITYSYTKNSNQIYPTFIHYPYDYHVKFKYDPTTRTDTEENYRNFFKATTAKRLKEIQIYSAPHSDENNIVRAYKLNYTYSESGRSKITSIKAYGRNSTLNGDGLVETSSPSLPATTFNYNGGGNSFSSKTKWHDSLEMSFRSYYSTITSGDFNGDGKNDLFYYDDSGWHVILSNGSTQFSNTNPYWYGDIPDSYAKLGDFNGDGKTDVFYEERGGGGNIHVMLSKGDHLEVEDNFTSQIDEAPVAIGDFNGDGKSDVLCGKILEDSTEQYSVLISKGNGFDGPYPWGTSSPNYHSNPKVADFNGDGKSDLLLTELDPDYDLYSGNDKIIAIYIRYSTGNSFTDAVDCPPVKDLGYLSGFWLSDLNGDGKTDFLNLVWNGELLDDGFYAMISDGSTLKSQEKWCDFDTESGKKSKYQVVDMNGDGKSDLFYCDRITYSLVNFNVMLSNGTNFENPNTWGSNNFTFFTNVMFSDFTGDGQPELFYIEDSEDFSLYVEINNSNYENVTLIDDSLGATTTVEYTPSSFWENDYLPFKTQTAKKVTTTDNVSHTAVKTYTYEGGYYDAEDREFRGFETSSVKDQETGFTTETHYYQDSVFKGRPSYSIKKDSNSNAIKRTDNTWRAIRLVNDSPYGSVFGPSNTSAIDDAKYYRTFTYLSKSVVTKYDNSGASFSTTTTSNTYDDYGNVLLQRTQTSDGFDKYTRTVFSNDTSTWLLGKPTKIRIDTSDPGTSSDTRALSETQYEYYSDRPWLIENEDKIHWADSSNYEVYTTTYGYDSYGNLISEIEPRRIVNADTGVTTKINYDSDGMFPIEIINALGQTTTRTFDPDFGKVHTETDPNLNTTTTNYDNFGRVDDVTFPDYSYKDYTYHVAANNHYMKVVASGQPAVTTYYDNFGRKTTQKKVATDGTTIYTETQYDDAGRAYRESLPSFDSGREWTTFHYNSVRGYLDKQTNPDSTFKTYTKNGFTETTTDENSHTKIVTKDVLDRIVTVKEATGGTASYTYDIFDNLETVTDPLGSVTTIEYDDLGRKILMDDPYMGVWEYGYDENGNLVLQVDGNLDQTVMEYDELNRLEEKYYITDGTQASYIYDEERTNYYNIGFLTTVEFGDMVTEYNYDEMGRTANEARTISGANSGNPYIIDRQFDLAGRLEYIQYPDSAQTQYDYFYNPIGTLSSVETGGTPLAEFFNYNALGQVGYVINKNLSGIYYDYTDDGSYRLEALTTVNGDNIDIQDFIYSFDGVGNITGITDNVSGTTQSFTYDSVDRLETAVATSSNVAREYDQSYTYDLAGNMTERTGIGPFKVWEWEDSTKHIRPALMNYKTEITGLADRSVTYNQNDKPTQISYDGTTTTHLYYDGEGNRVKKVQGGQEVVYVGNIYEERDGESLSYIYANGKKFVTITGSHEYYTHTDHLGSTTLTTDETGQVIEEIGYLPFGAELFRATYNNGTWESSYKFTGQEFDSEYEFYNYNARLYDPVMGRFITPDPIVAQPLNPQSLNRYSYCLNNPLIYVDPSGYYTLYQDGVYQGEVNSTIQADFGVSSSGTYYLGTDYFTDSGYMDYVTPGYTELTEEEKNAGFLTGYTTAILHKKAIIKDFFSRVVGRKPGDIFTIGLTYYHPVAGILGLGGGASFDRIIMPNGEADWFFTLGGGGGIAGGAISVDRGFIRKWPSSFADSMEFGKSDITGFSVSGDLTVMLIGPVGVGAEGAFTPFNWQTESRYGSEQILPMVTGKGGLRIGTPGAGVLGNWTWDLPF